MTQEKRRSKREWKKIVVAQRQSGLSAKRYCEMNSIGLASFYKWRGQFDEAIQGEPTELKNGFVEVGAMGAPSMSCSGTGWKACLEFGKLKLTLERG